MKTASHQRVSYITDTGGIPESQTANQTHLHVYREEVDDVAVDFDLYQNYIGKEWREGLVIVDFVVICASSVTTMFSTAVARVIAPSLSLSTVSVITILTTVAYSDTFHKKDSV